ncbi:aminoglycoside phosphotransferase family protein [Tenggerimyces flavus]|uniref:Phosphotransferase n=1 Tax=Tenggerimyces flavus TaxID=1708749 RepID=A0ABV7YNX7_9ACTN|nr:aminoglycoside phosphotransferase family protein [Tenggerimyces flavus]MBM7789455.1 aminoglycoside phosphotransferase (APT) family kinase protein [Tenggerimyces flavus]
MSLHAILTPPDLSLFRELTGVGEAELEVNFDGWSKLAVLSSDRVFLFPRRGRDEQLLHGARVSEALTALGVRCVPRVVGQWGEGVLSAGPFVAYERRLGVLWQYVEDDADLSAMSRLLESLGGAIASWHRLDLSLLPVELRGPGRFGRKQPWLNEFLEPDLVDDAADRVLRLLDPPTSWASIWRTALGGLAALPPVLLHGDVTEGQLLVDADGRVETVLDWDTAGIGHPLHDFDFGEWGFGIFGWEPDFASLRQVMWDAYRAGRSDAELPGWEQVHLLFTLAELAYFEQRERDGLNDDWGRTRLAHCRAALAPATESAA